MNPEIIQAYQEAATGILPGLRILVTLMWSVIAAMFTLMAIGTWSSLRHLWKSFIRDHKQRHDAQDLEEQVIRDSWDSFHDALDELKDGSIGVLRSCLGWFHDRVEAFNTWRRNRQEEKEQDRAAKALAQEAREALKAEALQVKAEVEAELPKKYHFYQRFWLWMNEPLLEKAVELAKAEIREEIRRGCNEAVSTATWNHLINSTIVSPEEEPVSQEYPLVVIPEEREWVVCYPASKNDEGRIWSYIAPVHIAGGRIQVPFTFGKEFDARACLARAINSYKADGDEDILNRLELAQVIGLNRDQMDDLVERKGQPRKVDIGIRQYTEAGAVSLLALQAIYDEGFRTVQAELRKHDPEAAKPGKNKTKAWMTSRLAFYWEINGVPQRYSE